MANPADNTPGATPDTSAADAPRGRRKSDELKAAVFDAMVAILRLIARIASDRNGGG